MIQEYEDMDQSSHDWGKAKRISVYIYPAQLQMIERICEKRKKTKRWVLFEAIQSYIGAFLQGKV